MNSPRPLSGERRKDSSRGNCGPFLSGGGLVLALLLHFGTAFLAVADIPSPLPPQPLPPPRVQVAIFNPDGFPGYEFFAEGLTAEGERTQKTFKAMEFQEFKSAVDLCARASDGKVWRWARENSGREGERVTYALQSVTLRDGKLLVEHSTSREVFRRHPFPGGWLKASAASLMLRPWQMGAACAAALGALILQRRRMKRSDTAAPAS